MISRLHHFYKWVLTFWRPQRLEINSDSFTWTLLPNSHWTYFCWNWISPVEKRTQSCELAFIWTTSHFYEDQRYVETNPFTKFSWNDIVGFLDFGRDYYDHPRSVVKFHNFFLHIFERDISTTLNCKRYPWYVIAWESHFSIRQFIILSSTVIPFKFFEKMLSKRDFLKISKL